MAKKSAIGPEEIIADIKGGRLAPVYILMGEETYYIDKIMEVLETSIINEEDRDFNLSTFYGADADIQQVEAACRQYPVMADRRVVLLKEAQALFQAKITLEKLAPYVAKPSPSTVFVISFKGGNINATSELLKNAKSGGAVIYKAEPLKDYQVPIAVKQYCASKRVNITDKAVAMLVQFVGNVLSTLFGEVDKLIVASGQKSGLTIDDALVEKIVGVSKEYNNFEFANALMAKDYPRVMTIIESFSKTADIAITLTLTGLLVGQYARLLTALMSPDKSDAGLMKALGLKSAYSLKDLRVAMAKYTPMQCVMAVHALRDFDSRSKGVDSHQNAFELLKEMVFRIFTA